MIGPMKAWAAAFYRQIFGADVLTSCEPDERIVRDRREAVWGQMDGSVAFPFHRLSGNRGSWPLFPRSDRKPFNQPVSDQPDEGWKIGRLTGKSGDSVVKCPGFSCREPSPCCAGSAGALRPVRVLNSECARGARDVAGDVPFVVLGRPASSALRVADQ